MAFPEQLSGSFFNFVHADIGDGWTQREALPMGLNKPRPTDSLAHSVH